MPMTTKQAIAYLREKHASPPHWIGCNFPEERCRCSRADEQRDADQAQYAIGVLERAFTLRAPIEDVNTREAEALYQWLELKEEQIGQDLPEGTSISISLMKPEQGRRFMTSVCTSWPGKPILPRPIRRPWWKRLWLRHTLLR